MENFIFCAVYVGNFSLWWANVPIYKVQFPNERKRAEYGWLMLALAITNNCKMMLSVVAISMKVHYKSTCKQNYL